MSADVKALLELSALWGGQCSRTTSAMGAELLLGG